MTATGARSQSLYRKYRPATFDERELVGQEHVSRTLRNAVRFDRVAHAYLFYGPRGCGKTTTARLLAKAVNCEDPEPSHRPCNACAACRAINDGRAVDIIEIDAASNRGIDAMRDLREKVKFSPAQLRAKFYIIDEVHQLTIDAANALLKTLEEPPAHANFILATTDPEKVPDTISSRCQTFTFRRIPLDRMMARLRDVATLERITVDDGALALIARAATGSLRDALGLLDQLSAYVDGAIGPAEVRQVIGAGREQEVMAVLDAIAANDAGAGLRAIEATVERGTDARQFAGQVVAYLRELLLALATKSAGTGLSEAHLTSFTLPEVSYLVKRFSQIDHAIKHGVYGQLPLELCLVESILWRTSQQQPSEVAVAQRPRPHVARPAVADGREFGAGAGPRDDIPAAATAEALAPLSAPVVPTANDRLGERPATPLGDANDASHGAPVHPPVPDAPGSENRPADDHRALSGAQRLSRLRDDWKHVRVRIKAEDRKLAAFMVSTDLAELHGDALRITAESQFHVAMLNQDTNKSIVERILRETYGREFQVSFELRDRQTGARPAATAVPVPASAAPGPGPEPIVSPPQSIATTVPAEPVPVTPEPAPAGDTAAMPVEQGARAVRERGAEEPVAGTPAASSADHEERYLTALRNLFNTVEIKG